MPAPSPYLNALDYPTLNDAVAAAMAAKLCLYIPQGDYTLTSAITIDAANGLSIIGAGPGITNIWLSGSISAFDFTGACTDVLLQGLSIIRSTADTSGYGVRITGIESIHSDSFILRDLLLQNIPHPLHFQYADRVFVDTVRYVQSLDRATAGNVVYLQSCISVRMRALMLNVTRGTTMQSGLIIDSDCDTITVENFELGGCSDQGVRLLNSLGEGHSGPRLVRLNDVYCENNGHGGFNIEAGRDVRLTGCHAAANDNVGFSIVGGDSIVFSTCLALQNKLHGISVGNANGVLIENCTASNNGQHADNSYSGIYVSADSVNGCVLIGNRSGDFVYALANKQLAGITLALGCDQVTVVANDLRGNKSFSLQDVCTADKIIYGNLPDNDARVGSSGAKVGFYGTPGIVQPTTGTPSATFVQGSGNAVNDASTFDGYTLAQVVKALRDLGLLQ